MGGGVNYRQHGGEHLSNKKELLRIRQDALGRGLLFCWTSGKATEDPQGGGFCVMVLSWEGPSRPKHRGPDCTSALLSPEIQTWNLGVCIVSGSANNSDAHSQLEFAGRT